MKFVFTERKGATAIWSVINPIASALVTRGDEVVFCRMDDGNQRQPLDVPAGVAVRDVHVSPKRKFTDLYKQHQAFSRGFSLVLEDCRPDVVHTHFCIPGISARLAAHQKRIPLLVSTQHELFGSMHPHYRLGLRLTERYVKGMTYVSRTVADSFGRPAQVIENGSSNRSSCAHAVIYNGVDIAKIDHICQAVPPREPRKLVCSGRMVPVKGQAVLIQAMPEILRRFADVRLVLIGTGSQEEGLKKQVTDLGLGSRVDFLGWRRHEEVITEVATAGASIMPNIDEEGFGLVLAEAMACGTPIVASCIKVFEEVLGEKDGCGWFFNKGDAPALAEAVCQVFSNAEEAQRRAARAGERVREHFSIDRMVRDYLAFYDALGKSLPR